MHSVPFYPLLERQVICNGRAGRMYRLTGVIPLWIACVKEHKKRHTAAAVRRLNGTGQFFSGRKELSKP